MCNILKAQELRDKFVKMKIIQTTLIVFFCFYCSPLIAKDYLGIYTTRPYLFLSFSEPYPEEIEKNYKQSYLGA
jgi:hypothetical protein